MEVFLIVCGIIGFIALICWLVSIDSNNGRGVSTPYYSNSCSTKEKTIWQVCEKLEELLKNDSHAIWVDGHEISEVISYENIGRFYVTVDGTQYRQRFGYIEPVHFEEYTLTAQQTENFLRKALEKPVVVESVKSKLKKKLKPILQDSSLDSIWMRVNNTPYYISYMSVINIETGEETYENLIYSIKMTPIVNLILSNDVIECEDPRKTYWQLFLKWEMETKKKLEGSCLKWVDNVLVKQKEYNDLRYQYEMIPSVPIVDYQTFKTFCGLVKDEVKYDEYLISNILLSKGLKVH